MKVTEAKIGMESKVEAIMRFSWKSSIGEHEENYYCKINMWRDAEFMPGKLVYSILGADVGDIINVTFKSGEVFKHSPENIITVDRRQFVPTKTYTGKIEPRVGRFYPFGFFLGIAGVFPENIQPVRVINKTEKTLEIDANNPIAKYDLDLNCEIVDFTAISRSVGGECICWCSQPFEYGPGMQIPIDGKETDFELDNPESFKRADESDDSIFYSEPRLINHIDRVCHENLLNLYRRIIPKGAKVLDLMSSYQSHIPAELYCQVTGLGMNEQEMRSNPTLHKAVVHDLNKNPNLPFNEEEFDVVVCDLSVEYLKNPIEVIKEISRVLKRDGIVSFSFSNRYFPEKVIKLWIDLHEFERMGFVIELLRKVGAFYNYKTYSFRRWRRPVDDKYFGCTLYSDPLYVVTARKS